MATVARATAAFAAPIPLPRLRTGSRPGIDSSSESSSPSQSVHRGRRVRDMSQRRSTPHAPIRRRALRMSAPGPPPGLIARSAHRATQRRVWRLHTSHHRQPSTHISSPVGNVGMDSQANGTVKVVAGPSTESLRLRSQSSNEDEDLTESTGEFDSIFATELASRLAAATHRTQSSDSSSESSDSSSE